MRREEEKQEMKGEVDEENGTDTHTNTLKEPYINKRDGEIRFIK